MNNFYYNLVNEYFFLKKKIIKIIKKGKMFGPRNFARSLKQTNKFKKRIKEIEKYLRENNLPHPESKRNNSNINDQLLKAEIKVGREILLRPDGQLSNRLTNLNTYGLDLNTRAALNPDGTLYESPILEGAMLNPQFHSQEKIQEFLNKKSEEED